MTPSLIFNTVDEPCQSIKCRRTVAGTTLSSKTAGHATIVITGENADDYFGAF